MNMSANVAALCLSDTPDKLIECEFRYACMLVQELACQLAQL